MRILIADTFSEAHVEQLTAFGHEVVVEPSFDVETLPAAIAGHDVLVVRSTRVDEATFVAADRLALIVRAGAGVNTIDVQAAADRGVVVSNTPGKNAIAVAELTMGLMSAIDRNIPDNVAELRAGTWNKERWSEADGLAGKRLGIVGFGSIGIEVARRAKGFAMQIVLVDRPGRRASTAAIVTELDTQLVPDLETLMGISDVISFHVPAAPETVGMLNSELLSHVRPGTVLINTSRGDILDEEALLKAIDEKDLRIGLDVYRTEPDGAVTEFGSELARHPSVYGTHHIGASTRQAQHAIADEVVAIVEAFGRGVMRNAVNLADGPSGDVVISVRHHDRVGVLAQVLELLRQADHNVGRMANTIFVGANAATATIALSGMPEAATIAAIEALDDVMAVSSGSVTGHRPAIRPFDAYLPRSELASEIVAPPLSTITSDRYEQLVADNPLSILHVLRTAIDSVEGGRDVGPAGTLGRRSLSRLISDGRLEPVGRDAFYVYRIVTSQRPYIGIIAEVAAAGLAEGSILPHEDTRSETEELVLEHFRRVRAHTDPVAMTYRADPTLDDLLVDVVANPFPTLDFEADDGSRQQLWVVADAERRDAMGTRLALVDRLYITDGHHRTAAARRLAEEQAVAATEHTGSEAYNYLPAVLFADDQLGLAGYHRIVTDIGDLEPYQLIAMLEKELRVEEIAVPWDEEARPRRHGAVGMFLGDHWYRVTFPPAPAGTADYEQLDAVRLQETILGPLLGIDDPRHDSRLQYVPGPAGLAELTRRAGAVGFALHPPAPQTVMSIADSGQVMPPKSTWFEPKVRAGIVVRIL